jgi:hypothetical protein
VLAQRVGVVAAEQDVVARLGRGPDLVARAGDA